MFVGVRVLDKESCEQMNNNTVNNVPNYLQSYEAAWAHWVEFSVKQR